MLTRSALAVAACAGMTAPAVALDILTPAEANLDRLRWEARPILVFADSPADPRLAEQLARFEEAAAALRERENVVIVDAGERSMLHKAYAPGPFAVILIGKDGGEKGRWTDPVPVAEINAMIDAMPMRRREIDAD